MSTKTHNGDGDGFNPEVMESEVDIAESLRMPWARDADKVKEILEATGAVAIKFPSSWWGNEAFGVWQEWFLVHPDGISPSGKALFVDKGTSLRDPVRRLNRAVSRSESGNGWTSKAVRRARRKALKAWEDDYMVGPGGGEGFDERDAFKDASCPLSVIEKAIRMPEPSNDLVWAADEDDPRHGKMSEGDVRVSRIKDTQYGPKFVLEGDTYKAFADCDDCDGLKSKIPWEDAHLTFDGDDWVCDAGGPPLSKIRYVLNNHGYTVAVDERFSDKFPAFRNGDESDSDDSFSSAPDF